MKHYPKLVDIGCFTRNQLIKLVGSEAAANQLIYDYQKKGLIEKVKRDFYVVISLETKQPVLSRYQIASNLFDDACLSHHSAFEIYGYYNQVYYECYVATSKRFRDFEYDGVLYKRVELKKGTKVTKFNKIRVTSIEQTVIDSIRDMEKISGLEEVLKCLMLIPSLKEDEILSCLAKENNGFLYQKCGFIFEYLKENFNFSDNFYKQCAIHSSQAKRYLTNDYSNNIYESKWKLYIPAIDNLINKGVYDYNAIG